MSSVSPSVYRKPISMRIFLGLFCNTLHTLHYIFTQCFLLGNLLVFCIFHKVSIYLSVEILTRSIKIGRKYDCLVAKTWNIKLHYI